MEERTENGIFINLNNHFSSRGNDYCDVCSENHRRTNSQAAFTAFKTLTINFRVVADCLDSLATLVKHNRFNLTFMLRHQGIKGNISADRTLLTLEEYARI